MEHYRSPRWLAGPPALSGNLQTIWPALFAKRFDGHAAALERERWNTPDGDFIDVDWLAATPSTPSATPATPPADSPPFQVPLLVLFHGLEGSSNSHYAQAFAHLAHARGWRFAVPHFRGCSGEINRSPRAYHAADYEEMGWILERMRAQHAGPVLAAGVSLGGNALLRWAEEAGHTAQATVNAVVAVSSPVDMVASGVAIARGFNRQIYTRMFLRTLIPKVLAKWEQHPGLFDRDRLKQARTLHDFDDIFTAPVHGFRGVADYYTRASSKPLLSRIRVPTLVLNARNDPFVPASSLPRHAEVGNFVTLWQPEHGGHVGFPAGRWPGHVMNMPEQVMHWLAPFSQGAA